MTPDSLIIHAIPLGYFLDCLWLLVLSGPLRVRSRRRIKMMIGIGLTVCGVAGVLVIVTVKAVSLPLVVLALLILVPLPSLIFDTPPKRHIQRAIARFGLAYLLVTVAAVCLIALAPLGLAAIGWLPPLIEAYPVVFGTLLGVVLVTLSVLDWAAIRAYPIRGLALIGWLALALFGAMLVLLGLMVALA